MEVPVLIPVGRLPSTAKVQSRWLPQGNSKRRKYDRLAEGRGYPHRCCSACRIGSKMCGIFGWEGLVDSVQIRVSPCPLTGGPRRNFHVAPYRRWVHDILADNDGEPLYLDAEHALAALLLRRSLRGPTMRMGYRASEEKPGISSGLFICQRGPMVE